MKVEVAGDPETGSVAQRRDLEYAAFHVSPPTRSVRREFPGTRRRNREAGNRSRPTLLREEELLQEEAR